VDFRVSAPTVSPLPTKNNLNLTKLSDQKKNSNDDKSLEKRDPSPSTSSTVKPPYSYIALSNYHIIILIGSLINNSHIFTVTMSILQSPQKKLTLSGICEFIMNR
jgi:forkhead box protein D